ncbi:MAG: beta-glucosidase [Halioglobus sp.]
MKNNLKLGAFSLILLVLGIGCKSNKVTNATKTVSTLNKYDKVESLLKKMTLEEKVGQMNLYNGFYDLTGPAPNEGDAAQKYDNIKDGLVGGMLNIRGVEEVRQMQKLAVENSRLGIPMIFGYDVIHGYKTQSPIPLAESASWDMKAIKKSSAMASREAAASGLNWTFAPMVDISRDPRWGRVMEGAGEDPYLGSKIAIARVQGFQGESLSDPLTLAACAKHFAGYGFGEGGRDYNSTDMSGTTLHNMVLPPFKAASDAGVATFMNGFNDLNGVPVNASSYLQRDILKGVWGFEGFVVSDWWSVKQTITHGQSATEEEATMRCANAGSDMDMESYFYIKHLAKLVRDGKVDEANITDAARRILNVKYELGLFDDPYKYCNEDREKTEIGSERNIADVRDMAKRSIVLLQNESGLLPLNRTNKKVAVIGPMVSEKNSPLGSWRLASEDGSAVSLQEGLEPYKGVDWSFYQGVKLIDKPTAFVFETYINETDRTGIDEAVEAAKSADIVIMALGEHGFQSGEARSRSKLGLPGLQQELLEAIQAVNKNVVLVLFNGRPLTLPWAKDNIPTIVEAWQLGNESGNAIADVLMGEYNPSGKLPMTFPRSVGQIPSYYNTKSTGRPDQPSDKDLVFWSHYSDETLDPLYAFGHGLSYTTFEYSKLKADKKEDGSIEVSVSVANTGGYDGEEVIQLYIRDLYSSFTRPIKELKGFRKTEIKSGRSKSIKFTLTDKELGWFDNEGKWFVETGEYEVMVGGSSDDVIKVVVDTTPDVVVEGK